MTTGQIISVDPSAPDAEVVARAASVIRRGGLVGMPTETVYGLAGDALDPTAVARIYAAKGRPQHSPLIVHVASVDQARELASEWPRMAQALAERFWPGPLTLIVRRRGNVPDAVTAGLDTFGVRVPDHPVALALIRASHTPLAAPSANKFTEVSPVTAQQVANGLGDAVELILDAGRSQVGIESTVVDVSGGRPVVLRPGMISRADIEAVVGPTARRLTPTRGNVVHRSPGQSARHYAPRARVRLLETSQLDTALAAADSSHTGIILCQSEGAPAAALAFSRSLGADPKRYGAGLYDALHAADAAGCEELLVEAPPDTPAWDAIRDRLRRAAHP
ncbi:MAG: threonylcarbamoyl-AMP synthase [Gemmatimonadaceae bacterium]|nr:threonylcarbamoyl-AMP synthase [Gemmatimonadaceae bacterium]